MKRQYERIDCPACGRRISAYIPHMGDGSDVRIVPHALVNPASTRTRSVTCPASNRLAGEYRAAEALIKSLLPAPQEPQGQPEGK